MASDSLTDSLRETLALFDGSGTPRTTNEVAESLELGRRSAYDRLKRLVDQDRLETKKVGASARVWWRPPSTAGAEQSARHRGLSNGRTGLVDSVLDGAGVGVFVLDADAEVVRINETAERFFGVDRGEVLGREKRTLVEERIAPAVEDSASFAGTVLATYDDNTYAEQFECRVTAGEGREERWLEHRSKPIESGPHAGGRIELYYDVTARKRSERARRRDREQFESLIRAVEEYAIFRLDADGRVRTWNEGAERIKGYEAGEILGEHVSTFYTDEDREAGVPAANLAAAREHGSTEDEGWRVCADGSRFWANVTITAIRGDDGRIEGYLKVTRDMTERRERERELRRERDLVEQVFETSPVHMGVFGSDGELRRANDRLRDLLDVDGSYTAGDRTLLGEDGTPLSFEERPVGRVIETGEPVSGQEVQVRTAEGASRWLSVNAAPVRDGDGFKIVVAATDVTQFKRQAQRLERYRDELEHELEGMFERVDDAFIALDDEWRFTYLNERAATVLDRPESSLVGRTVWDAFPEAVGSTFETEYRRAMESQESVSFEEYYPPLERWFEVNAYPSENGLSVYFRDVTDRKRRERELEQYEAIVETVGDGVYVVDEENRFLFVNDAHCELTGYDREELLGSHASLVTTEEDVDRAERRRDDLETSNESVATIETELVTDEGERVPVETRFALFPLDDGHGRCGVVRDVSERLERERTLEKRVRQQEAITDLGRRALEHPGVDVLAAEAAELVADTLDTDYCKVLDLDPDAGELLLRQGVGWDDGVVGSATVPAVDDDSQAAHTLDSAEPVVVSDLDAESRFSGPDLLTDHDVESGISTIVGTPDDPWGVIGTHDRDPATFSEQDVTFVQSVANVLATAIDRHRYEEALLGQREQLAALNDLNEVVREITTAVIDRSTREEIEETVCERLAATDSYLFAWIGDVDVASETVRLRTEAGVEGYLDDITISVDPDDEHSEGATGRALRTGEIQTTQDIHADHRYEPWREQIEAYGFRSSAAIPISHGETVYGALNVYAERAEAFEGRERTVISQLGEVVGHAIAAAERKRALMGDDVVELEFRIRDVFDALDVPDATTGRITLDHVVPVEDETYLVYGSVAADAVDTVAAMVDSIPHWEAVTFRDDDGETAFELRLSEPPVLSVVASLGGAVEEALIEDGDYHMTLHAAPSVDVRRITEAVREAYPAARLLKRRQVTRRDGTDDVERVLWTDLTDRQQTALEAAFYAGFFEWPRKTTGEDVAGALGIAPSTFHQHLRKAERKVLDSVLSSPPAVG